MRGYNCYIYEKDNENKLIKNTNTACFAGLHKYFQLENKEKIFIYIQNFKEDETKNNIPLLLNLINKITPCKIVVIEEIEYIEFKLLKTYDQSLILLNFIRNLWSKVSKEYLEKNYEVTYNFHFFETLKNYKKLREPLKRLTYANLKGCELSNIDSRGHSNTQSYNTLKIKTTKELLKYTGNSTRKFLTE